MLQIIKSYLEILLHLNKSQYYGKNNENHLLETVTAEHHVMEERDTGERNIKPVIFCQHYSLVVMSL